MKYHSDRTDWFYTGFALLIVTLVASVYIPVQSAEGVVTNGTWVTTVELIKTTIRIHCDGKTCTPHTSTSVLDSRSLMGDWSEEVVWPEPYEAKWSGQSNRYRGQFTITYRHNDVAYSGQVSEAEFGRYYAGMPCKFWLNVWQNVVRDACEPSVGR